MKIQVLVATVGQTDYSLLEKMNIQTDAIVANQCDKNQIDDLEWRGHRIRYLNFAERGVGLNRNNALMRADGDICLFADDDMVYVDGYDDIVRRAFEEILQADVIVFNLTEKSSKRKQINKISRVGYLNYLRYGTARVAVRLKSVREQGIYFNQCFGGGTPHSHGEDNLFLNACLKKGLKIYSYPISIAALTDERESSWNVGYNEKYLMDQGILYKTLSRRWYKLLCLQDAIRRRRLYKTSAIEAYGVMLRGAKSNNSR